MNDADHRSRLVCAQLPKVRPTDGPNAKARSTSAYGKDRVSSSRDSVTRSGSSVATAVRDAGRLLDRRAYSGQTVWARQIRRWRNGASLPFRLFVCLPHPPVPKCPPGHPRASCDAESVRGRRLVGTDPSSASSLVARSAPQGCRQRATPRSMRRTAPGTIEGLWCHLLPSEQPSGGSRCAKTEGGCSQVSVSHRLQ
jgi:hypothetical protein